MLEILRRQQLMPLFYHDDLEVCLGVMKAAWAAGLHCFEFTNRGAFAKAHFTALMDWKTENAPSLHLGVGTITRVEDAQWFIDGGAAFVVSPFGNATIADACYYDKIPYLPGCMTLREMAEAKDWGVEIVKLFPGDQFSPAFIKAIKGPMPELEIMVTGGVSPQNLAEWKKSGATAMGLGSSFISTQHIQTRQWQALEDIFASAIQTVNS